MGTSTSVAQLAGKIEGLARDIANPKVALNRTALEGKRIFEASAAAAGVLGSKPAGKRKVVSARYDVSADGKSAIVTYVGPAHLVNNPTRPHRIEPRRRRGVRGRRRGATALTIEGNVRMWANHPGTSGKHFFEKARAIATHRLPRTFAKAGLSEPLRRNFR